MLEWNEKTIRCVPEVDGEPASPRTDFPEPLAASTEIKRVAKEIGAAMVGITHVDPFHVYKGMDLAHKFAIVIAVPMEYDEMKYGATERHVREVLKIYAVAGGMAVELGKHIRALGYPARAHSLRFEQLNMLPHAQAAGLGELGKHGSLINRELGCSFRVAVVTTDLPLAVDAPVDWGVDEVCTNCNMCVRYCPGDAIAHDKQDVRGINRWTVDTEACAPYWGTYYSCGICLEVCPFNAKSHGGKYKKSLVEMIRSIDLPSWRTDLKDGLQQPWQHVEQPDNQEFEGWRNNVAGKGAAAFLLQGIPSEGLPQAIYDVRAAMNIDPNGKEPGGEP
jgi:epoxyqueuosine reductase QueG